jgi:hypothetical protein
MALRDWAKHEAEDTVTGSEYADHQLSPSASSAVWSVDKSTFGRGEVSTQHFKGISPVHDVA